MIGEKVSFAVHYKKYNGLNCNKINNITTNGEVVDIFSENDRRFIVVNVNGSHYVTTPFDLR